MRLRIALLAAALGVLAGAIPAHAADPGRWRETGRTSLPLTYYQGVTHNTAGDWLFDGVYSGLWRTDRAFAQTAGVADVIPQDVTDREGYNHIGDIGFDRGEGGRVILPLECYYPPRGNTCNTGSFGVADPVTLAWRYYVKLDPAEIPKAMWSEVSPDGSLIWTSAGDDLLAYRTTDVSLANAAPGAAPIRAVRRLVGAAPPPEITGAAFVRGRLFVAIKDLQQVWSIDLATGKRRLELERAVNGESEGLDTFSASGGILHWLIQPLVESGKPTYGAGHATLVHFRSGALAPRGKGRRSLRLEFAPGRVTAGTRVRFHATVTTGSGSAVRGAYVAFAGYRARTDRRGHATLAIRLRSPAAYRVTATARGRRAVTVVVRAR